MAQNDAVFFLFILERSQEEQICRRLCGLSRISKMENKTEIKPTSSAYILIDMCVDEAPQIKIKTRVCVDTGADMTICSHTFIIKKFGEETLQSYVKEMENPPRLKSASGHSLKVFGFIELDLFLGEYKLPLKVMVYENKADFLLLGADAFYDRLIFVSLFQLCRLGRLRLSAVWLWSGEL